MHFSRLCGQISASVNFQSIVADNWGVSTGERANLAEGGVGHAVAFCGAIGFEEWEFIIRDRVKIWQVLKMLSFRL